MPRSTFYYHLKVSKTDKCSADKQAIREVFEENEQRYGYRRITDELHAKGIIINHKKVLRLMKMLGIQGKKRKNEEYHSYKGEVGKVAGNLLNRDFNAGNAFEKLATDVTQFKVKDRKVYLSPIMDLYNNEITSYSISLHPDLAQIREMLDGLGKKLPKDATPILHSDQGWQYQHTEYQRYLKEHNIVQSMSRKGNCMDNGADLPQTKRNESGAIPNSLPNHLIKFLSKLWGSLQSRGAFFILKTRRRSIPFFFLWQKNRL